ncbi:hypothetical protein DH2020_045604 [Rehmannia glutinosa]|uniref:Reverse transcriptase Ty1/copia-type domain-containing protein n=1 Tax=Rehmannia glutinosa TaxID=99300 RepID=A0ABR0UDQ2_REHGL
MKAEFDSLLAKNTWTLVPCTPDLNVISNKWVFRIKHKVDGSVDKFKARLVARGFEQTAGVDFHETFSPVIKPCTIRLIFTLAVTNQWSIQQIDVNNAFLNGDLKQTSSGVQLFILIYVDDILLTGNDAQKISEVIHLLNQQFALKTLGEVNYFLGLEAHRSAAGLLLSQTKYIHDLLSHTHMLGCKPSPTPIATGQKLSLLDSKLFDHPSLYRSVIGTLQYLTLTRPDIAFTVNKLSQFLHQPTVNHWAVCKHLLRYLKGTMNLGVMFRPAKRMLLEAYSDADWASSLDDRKSTGGHFVLLGGNLLLWSAKKQGVVSRSSAESEYRSLADTTADLVWLQSLLKELDIKIEQSSLLWCDNMSAVAMASNPVFHARTKHIEIDIHFVRDKVLSKAIDIRYIPSEDQPADLFTKPLSSHRFQLLCAKLPLSSSVKNVSSAVT